MRIRQVRPDFFTDGRVSRLSPEVRLTYIGLWCAADDDGWLAWDPVDLGGMLFPHEPIDVREARLELSRTELEAAGRVVFHPCGCARIPTLPVHQKIGGTKSYTARDKHERNHVHRVVHKSTVQRSMDSSIPRTLVGSEVGSESRERDDEEALRASFRRQGLPVDAS